MKTNSRVILLTGALIGVGAIISLVAFSPSPPELSEDPPISLPTQAIDTHSNLIRELDANPPKDLKTATFAVG